MTRSAPLSGAVVSTANDRMNPLYLALAAGGHAAQSQQTAEAWVTLSRLTAGRSIWDTLIGRMSHRSGWPRLAKDVLP
jgi:hypothetical protein